MGDDSEWMKLPIDQKCEHKVGHLLFGFGLWFVYLCVYLIWFVYLCCGKSVVFPYLFAPKIGNVAA